MLDVQMRPTLRFVQQIAQIERFAGAWDRLSQSAALASEQRAAMAIHEGAIAALALDVSTPPTLSLLLSRRFSSEQSDLLLLIEREVEQDGVFPPRDPILPRLHPDIASYVRAHHWEGALNIDAVKELYRQSSGIADHREHSSSSGYRRAAIQFVSPDDWVVFPAVSAFVIEQRMEELFEWARRELSSDVLHPLAVIGAFHLLFLQIHPFPTANHRVALLLTWLLLVENGYNFVRFRHLAPICLAYRDQYFNALRQAEKTAGTDWSTLNVWLEFFLEVLLEGSRELLEQSERTVDKARLSRVQKRILSVVREYGAVTRERIVNETGINLSTVKYNLSVLAERGHLRRHGGGRTTSYSAI